MQNSIVWCIHVIMEQLSWRILRNEAGSNWEIDEAFGPKVTQQDPDKLIPILGLPLKLQKWILVRKTIIFISIYLFLLWY
jgi:hypothetical protein